MIVHLEKHVVIDWNNWSLIFVVSLILNKTYFVIATVWYVGRVECIWFFVVSILLWPLVCSWELMAAYMLPYMSSNDGSRNCFVLVICWAWNLFSVGRFIFAAVVRLVHFLFCGWVCRCFCTAISWMCCDACCWTWDAIIDYVEQWRNNLKNPGR